MNVVRRLLELAGWEWCPICKTYTMDWRGYHEDVSLCADCAGILNEANELTEDEHG